MKLSMLVRQLKYSIACWDYIPGLIWAARFSSSFLFYNTFPLDYYHLFYSAKRFLGVLKLKDKYRAEQHGEHILSRYLTGCEIHRISRYFSF